VLDQLQATPPTRTSPGQPMEGEIHVVGTDYLAAMRMRLVRGRGFTADDVRNSSLVILVNETFTGTYRVMRAAWVSLDLDDAPCGPTNDACSKSWHVIGIVADVRLPGPTRRFSQKSSRRAARCLEPCPDAVRPVRTTGDPEALAVDLRAIVKGASPNAVLEQAMTMETRLMRSLASPRL
jgi:hypothetical protein